MTNAAAEIRRLRRQLASAQARLADALEAEDVAMRENVALARLAGALRAELAKGQAAGTPANHTRPPLTVMELPTLPPGMPMMVAGPWRMQLFVRTRQGDGAHVHVVAQSRGGLAEVFDRLSPTVTEARQTSETTEKECEGK